MVRDADGGARGVRAASGPRPGGPFRCDGVRSGRSSFDGRGLGSAIIDWTEARDAIAGSPRLDDRLWHSVQAERRRARRAARGVVATPQVRSFWHMALRPGRLDRRGADPGRRRRSDRSVIGRGRARPRTRSSNTAFRDPLRPRGARRSRRALAQQDADDTWDPTLGLLAEVDGTVVRAQRRPGDRRGRLRRSSSASCRRCRGRGIAKALLRHAFAMLAARGSRR